MRKLYALLLFFACMGILAGCGGVGAGAATGTTGANAPATTTSSGGSTTAGTSTPSPTPTPSPSPSGFPQTSFSLGNTPNSMALNSLGHAWTTQIGPTQEFDAQGNNLASNPLTATGIAIDGAGNPWVATSNGINKINPITGSGSPFPGNNNSATTAGPVAIDQAGNVWSASIVTGNLVELSSSGNELTEFPVVPPPSTPSALAIDANGTLWVTSNDGFLRAATPNGTLTQQIQLGGAPQNIAIDQIGNLWVTDHQNNVVDEISTAGTVLGNFAVGNAPTAVAVDQSGSVYVANGLDGTISVLDAAGNITSTIPVNPLANTTASTQPIALGIDASGNIWVLDASFNSVHVVDKAAKGPQFFPYRGPQYPWGSGLSSD